MKHIAVLLFEDFETLDVFGPVGIFGRLMDLFTIKFFSLDGGEIRNRHGVAMKTEKLSTITMDTEIFLIPGGQGTRREVENRPLIGQIARISDLCKYVLTVCTGSALLAQTGLLDRKAATSNKRAFAWAMTNGAEVLWNRNARWTVDGKFYTSSGVSAGMDMALGFLCDCYGIGLARKIALEIEYNWTEDKNDDVFRVE
ncbi:MAG: DJ-1/PfpI family protein [Breznakibacter sp.]